MTSEKAIFILGIICAIFLTATISTRVDEEIASSQSTPPV